MQQNHNKFIAISLMILIFIFLGYFIYNIKEGVKVYNKKNTPTVIESEADEKYIISPLQSDAIKGSKEVGVNIFVFSNYGILKNKELFKIFDTLLNKYPDKINLVWKDFWESNDYLSSSASTASRCAGEQNKYFEFAGKLMDDYSNLNRKTYIKISGDLKLDETKFLACLDSNKYNQDIYYNLHEADVLDVKTAPTIFVNQQKFQGDITQDNLENVIKALIK